MLQKEGFSLLEIERFHFGLGDLVISIKKTKRSLSDLMKEFFLVSLNFLSK